MHWTRDFGVANTGYPTDDDVYREQMSVVTTEDIPMVEAQQENIDAFGPLADAPAKQDLFIINVHRVLTEAHRARGRELPPELKRVGKRAQELIGSN
jgi:hypothetical protein